MNKRILAMLIAFLAFTFRLGAMNSSEPQMADLFRQEGKIFVVIAVIALIFLAIIVFLIYIDRSLKKLEQELNKNKNQVH